MPKPPTTPTNPVRSGAQGRSFRAARQGAGLSVRSLAERAEISHSTISRWERGEREISETTYQHLTLTLADYMAGRWAA
jgi:transcriptional regulator with XRE-family HTH domain